MDEFMIERLTKRGKYEDSAGLRYFGNEKFRKKNYFGKQKLEVNKKRVFGLTVDPGTLLSVRTARMRSMRGKSATDYTDPDQVMPLP